MIRPEKSQSPPDPGGAGGRKSKNRPGPGGFCIKEGGDTVNNGGPSADGSWQCRCNGGYLNHSTQAPKREIGIFDFSGRIIGLRNKNIKSAYEYPGGA